MRRNERFGTGEKLAPLMRSRVSFGSAKRTVMKTPEQAGRLN
jgi:hypothetical protein